MPLKTHDDYTRATKIVSNVLVALSDVNRWLLEQPDSAGVRAMYLADYATNLKQYSRELFELLKRED